MVGYLKISCSFLSCIIVTTETFDKIVRIVDIRLHRNYANHKIAVRFGDWGPGWRFISLSFLSYNLVRSCELMGFTMLHENIVGV